MGFDAIKLKIIISAPNLDLITCEAIRASAPIIHLQI